MSDPLQIVIWDVEHGSAAFARTPNNRTIIFDAGASTSFSPAKWLHDRYSLTESDLFVLSHADTDHIRDIDNVADLIPPRIFHRNKSAPTSLVYPTFPPVFNPLKRYYTFDQKYCSSIAAGSSDDTQQPANWGGVTLRFFANTVGNFTKLNDYSLLTVILYGNLEIVFPGDLEAPGWKDLLENQQLRGYLTPSTANPGEKRVLVASHHGRQAGVYQPVLDLYKPHLTIVSDVHGSPYTAYPEYYAASSGFSVYDSSTKKYDLRYTLSTKMNSYILLIVNSDGSVSIRI